MWPVQRQKDFLRVYLVYLPVLNAWSVDGTHLSTLAQGKMHIVPRRPRSINELTPPSGRAGEQMQLKPLYAVLPAHAVAAFLACLIEIPVPEDLLQPSDLLASLDAFLFTPFLASFISAFSSTHNNFCSPPVPVLVGHRLTGLTLYT